MNKTLLLVDGSSYLYRAYHAMPNMRNAAGEPTGALYGVINMMQRLAQDHKADWLACVFDAPGRTFRDDLYADYKANRQSMPEDLAAQIPAIHAAVRALGWPVIAVPGVEADDVIATLARRASANGAHTIISTGDKDLAQLVTPTISLLNTMTGERLDEAGVLAKFGVPPERIVEYLMLVGDTADNIPGVEKVGPKTAARWLNEYGSLDALLAAADGIKGVAAGNLRAAAERLPLSRELVTVRDDCALADIDLASLDDLRARPQDKDTLIQLYDQYGFRSWLREMTGDAERLPSGDPRLAATRPAADTEAPGASAPPPPAPVEVSYTTVTSWEAFDDWLARLKSADLVAVDTETVGGLGAHQAHLVGISLAVAPGEACYIPLAHRAPGLAADAQLPMDEVLARLKPWLEDETAAKVLHHAKFDTHAFVNSQIALAGIRHDTLLQGYVLAAHQTVGLDALVQRHLGHAMQPYEALCGKGAKQIGFDQVDLESASHYASEDADYTLRLHHALWPQVQADTGLSRIYDLELAVSGVLAIIEDTGVRIDVANLARQSQMLGTEMDTLQNEAYTLAGQPFNLNSPKQLGEILFGQLGLPVVRKTPGGAPSTDESVLSELALDHPLPRALLDYRGLSKLKSTYTDKLPRMVNPGTGRVHTSYAQAVTVTGRLASSDPNLQNIPVRTEAGRRVRQAFVAGPGMRLLSADYSQIELRVMAHVADDPGLQAAFAAGRDIHRATAGEVFHAEYDAVTTEQRRAAKAINFGLIYGMGAHGLAGNLGITRDAAQLYIDRYFARYPNVAEFMERIRVEARRDGYVQTLFGRRVWLPEIQGGSGPRRKAAERAAINAPMQGTAADLIKFAMVEVQAWLEREQLAARLIMQVHDELVIEAPLDEVERVRAEVPTLMAGVAELRVPLVAEIGDGDNWDQAH